MNEAIFMVKFIRVVGLFPCWGGARSPSEIERKGSRYGVSPQFLMTSRRFFFCWCCCCCCCWGCCCCCCGCCCGCGYRCRCRCCCCISFATWNTDPQICLKQWNHRFVFSMLYVLRFFHLFLLNLRRFIRKKAFLPTWWILLHYGES